MKSLVLQGVHLLFSSVIPLGVDQPRQVALEGLYYHRCLLQECSSEIWKLAESFGATCWQDLSSTITHVIAGKVSGRMFH